MQRGPPDPAGPGRLQASPLETLRAEALRPAGRPEAVKPAMRPGRRQTVGPEPASRRAPIRPPLAVSPACCRGPAPAVILKPPPGASQARSPMTGEILAPLAGGQCPQTPEVRPMAESGRKTARLSARRPARRQPPPRETRRPRGRQLGGGRPGRWRSGKWRAGGRRCLAAPCPRRESEQDAPLEARALQPRSPHRPGRVGQRQTGLPVEGADHFGPEAGPAARKEQAWPPS